MNSSSYREFELKTKLEALKMENFNKMINK